MKNVKKLLALLIASLMVVTVLAGCKPVPQPEESKQEESQEEKDPLAYAPGTILRMATGYNSAKTGLFFDADTAGEGITLAGKTYNAGDLKPTWAAISELLGIQFEDHYQGNSATNEFKYWQERLGEIDMVAGAAATLSEYGATGALVNLADYLDAMPNFKAYLEANPIVMLSILGDTDNGAIYFSPYFDGVNDIERMPLMRTDWAEKLLNGDGPFTAEQSKELAAAVYTPYMPVSGKVAIDVVKADGTGVETINKDYDKAGNIIEKMNAALAAGTVDGVTAVNMLRTYIDEAYNGYYGTKRADLFIGQNAAWDADEMVALLRCVVANPYTLNGTDTVQGLFSREDANNQRTVDIFRFAGTLFGVRGLESRSDYLFIDENGKMQDARVQESTYAALEKMNAMVQEGLVSSAFINSEDVKSSNYLEKDLGFMSYDYNQTQTILNETKLQNADGEKYMAIMVPVALWFDGTPGGVYMRFTESWRSVKTDAWAITAAGAGVDENKLHAALKLIDYAYSPEGQIMMSYGPDDFIKKNADGSYVTFNFNGKEMPVIADETYELLWDLAGGNYTNFARYYLGSTLSFVKSQAFEYQCTHEIGKEGAGYISAAIGYGIIKHPELDIAANAWYTSVPTVLPNTTVENEVIKGYSELSSNFSTSKGGQNLLLDIIRFGYAGEGTSTRAETIETVKTTWKVNQLVMFKQQAFDRLTKYYNANVAK